MNYIDPYVRNDSQYFQETITSPAKTPEKIRQEMMSKKPEDRAEYTRSVAIRVDHYRHSLDYIDNLINRSARSSRPGGVWVIGDGGVGKSFILDAIHRCYPPTETDYYRNCPVLSLAFDSRPAESDILLTLLLQLGQHPDTITYKRNSDLVAILLDALAACKTQAILFDEAQHLWLNTRAYRIADRVGGRLGDFLKRLYDDSGLAFVFAGTSGLEDLLDKDTQARTRWSGRLKLTPFQFDNYFVGVLNALDEALPMENSSGLGTPKFAEPIFKSSQGNFRLLKNLIAEAVYIAASDKSPKILQEHLARAHFLTFGIGENPFNTP